MFHIKSVTGGKESWFLRRDCPEAVLYGKEGKRHGRCQSGSSDFYSRADCKQNPDRAREKEGPHLKGGEDGPELYRQGSLSGKMGAKRAS